MKPLFIILLATALYACNPVKDSMQDAVTGTLEKAIEAKTGTQVDLGDIDTYAETSGSVVMKAGDNEYLKKEEKLQAVAMFQKDKEGLSISFQFSGESGKSLVLIASHIPENFTLPVSAKFAVSNSYDGVNPVATLLFMQVAENGMLGAPVPYEGTLTISSLTEKEMTFTVDAKGGLPNETDSPSAWKPIVVTGVLKSPIIQALGIDKQKVLR